MFIQSEVGRIVGEISTLLQRGCPGRRSSHPIGIADEAVHKPRQFHKGGKTKELVLAENLCALGLHGYSKQSGGPLDREWANLLRYL